MKKILYSLSLLCLILTTSCTQELQIDDSALEPGTITLTLQSVDAQTKATQAGETAYNENLIKSVHYFFYPKDGTDSNTEKEPAKRGQVTNLEKQNQHTITVNASEDEIKNILFKYPYNDCDVYVIVNLPSDINIDGLPDHKLSTLKQIVLEDANFEANLIQPSFVMEGLNVAKVEDRNKVLAAKGTIPVDRVAAKITVSIEVDDRIDLQTPPDTPDNLTSGMIWTSEPKQMTIEFVNGVNRTVLSGNPDNLTLTPDDRYNVIHSVPTIPEGEPDPESWTCEPFYTYPTKWEIGSDEEPYLFITLPWTTVIWTSVDGQQPPIYKTYPCYYKIMLGSNELKRNTWYDLKINIGILGSFENTPEVILPIEEVEYFVADWSDGLNVDSEILGAKYLVVDKERYEVFNEPTLLIPFTTSHDCKIVGVSCEYPNLKTGDDVPESASNYSIDIENGNTIKLTHELNNNMLSDDFDFTPFTFVFTIQHIEDPTYKKEITVVQYPAIYAEAKANSNWKGTSYSNAQNNDQNGYMYVNGYQGYTGDSRPNGVDFFLSAGGLYNNTSPNMYVFTVTTTEGTNYVIGDPRDTEYTYDAGDAWWSSSPAIYNGNANRELNYYYGTLIANARYTNATNQTGVIYADDAAAEAAEPTINMIAPKFRLASGYSVLYTNTTSMTMENLKKRCASYQEDGYPAGRWRMPTRAEFQFIMTQVNKENLPELYYSGNSYWCAHGIGTPQDDGSIVMSYRGYATATNGYSVRCVYDEWYWENSSSYRLPENQKDTFTWGDMPRDQFDAKTE